jgi:hypothetical protein
VAVWYSGLHYVLQLTLWQFGIADRFMYCSLQYGNLVYLTALCTEVYSVAVCYSDPLYVLQLTVWQFGIADRFMYCSLQSGSMV